MIARTALVLLVLAAHPGCRSTPGVWRPFSPDSPWNTPIGPDAAVHPDSPELVADLAARGPLRINLDEWSIPVYEVDSGRAPVHAVRDARPDLFGAGFEPPRAIPIPAGATASLPPGGDEHLCILDRRRGLEWGMWQARLRPDGTWETGLGAVTDLRGTGVAPAWNEAERELDAHRARASGFPLIAGLIRVEEIRAGRIDHALVFAYDGCMPGRFLPPASTSQAAMPMTREDGGGLPMGARIQLDPELDLAALDLTPAGRVIARALQEYGAYLGDYAGATVLYGESSPAALRAWEGVLAPEDLGGVFDPAFLADNLRVLDTGAWRPGQNFGIPANGQANLYLQIYEVRDLVRSAASLQPGCFDL